jgi:hypothetical protein
MFNLLFLIRGIRILTFPGVFAHELAHELACRLLGVTVSDVNYFKFTGETLGSVSRSPTNSVIKAFLISFAPLFLNVFLGLALLIPSWVYVVHFESGSYALFLRFWVAASILAHACPSHVDAEIVLEEIRNLPYSSRRQYGLIRLMAGFFTMPDMGVLELVFTWVCITQIPPLFI